MSTRDLGAHMAELHDLGTLSITGEGTRITLSAQESLDLLHWLFKQRNVLYEATKTQEAGQLPAWIRAEPEEVGIPLEERDSPVDEP